MNILICIITYKVCFFITNVLEPCFLIPFNLFYNCSRINIKSVLMIRKFAQEVVDTISCQMELVYMDKAIYSIRKQKAAQHHNIIDPTRMSPPTQARQHVPMENIQGRKYLLLHGSITIIGEILTLIILLFRS